MPVVLVVPQDLVVFVVAAVLVALELVARGADFTVGCAVLFVKTKELWEVWVL